MEMKLALIGEKMRAEAKAGDMIKVSKETYLLMEKQLKEAKKVG